MNAAEFVILVRDMRDAQKQYYKSRLRGDLVKAKELEQRCDKVLADGVAVRNGKYCYQLQLFDLSGPPASGLA